MNILQFESLNLEFICKRYEINKFWNSKYKTRSNSAIKQKGGGFSAKIQGPAHENQRQRVDSQKAESLFNETTTRRGTW
jgi:DNA topoisomerase IA